LLWLADEAREEELCVAKTSCVLAQRSRCWYFRNPAFRLIARAHAEWPLSLLSALAIPVLGKLVPCYNDFFKNAFVAVNAPQLAPPTGIFETVGGGSLYFSLLVSSWVSQAVARG
jgi:hypothetical protein